MATLVASLLTILDPAFWIFPNSGESRTKLTSAATGRWLAVRAVGWSGR
jgi:hypothetical protein